MPSATLDGIRVLDLGMFMAGPLAGRFLGEMGAQVIKIESGSRPDPLRFQARDIFPGGEPGERPWNRSGMINERNRSKMGLSLDLRSGEGKEIFLDLVKVSDVILENFRIGVMAALGLDFASLQQANPTIVQVSLTSQGSTGPEAHFGSAGATLEYTSGLMSITGYPGDWPDFSGPNLPDFLAPYAALGLTVAALRHRRCTGCGVWLDLSQREAAVCTIGEAVMDYTMNGRVQAAAANRHSYYAPHGVFRCEGEDRWVTIAVRNDEEWGSLCRIISRQDLVGDPRFATALLRWENQEELRSTIEAWTGCHTPTVAMDELQAAGVPAGAVLNVAEMYDDPQFRAHDYFDEVHDPDAGTFRYPGRPWRYSRSQVGNRSPAPRFGEHTAYLCGELLGMSGGRVSGLVEQGVLAERPSP